MAGVPAWEQRSDSAKLLYRFETTALPVQRMRVKVEINTREHFSVDGLQHMPFAVSSPWHSADELVTTFTPEELLATKMRALFLRRKGRDLYDLWLGLTSLGPDEVHIIECLGEYLERTEMSIVHDHLVAHLPGEPWKALGREKS